MGHHIFIEELYFKFASVLNKYVALIIINKTKRER